jgi:hypothetical protein
MMYKFFRLSICTASLVRVGPQEEQRGRALDERKDLLHSLFSNEPLRSSRDEPNRIAALGHFILWKYSKLDINRFAPEHYQHWSG